MPDRPELKCSTCGELMLVNPYSSPYEWYHASGNQNFNHEPKPKFMNSNLPLGCLPSDIEPQDDDEAWQIELEKAEQKGDIEREDAI
jgi:hypothetical protein